MSAKDQHSEPPVSLRERVTQALDGTITMTKRALLYTLSFILLFFVTLTGLSPFWVRRALMLNTNVVWLPPNDPENKMSWVVHNKEQCDALLKTKCQELQQGSAQALPQPQPPTPKSKWARRPRR